MAIIISAVLAVPTAAFPLTVGAENNNNPVIKGSFADPDIDVFGCRYWIYPTTDGNPGWSGTQFHAFSSENLTDWTDEGVILDVADDNPSVNSKGVQIASSPWSCGNAWAPAIEEKDGKYYFYYCGRIKEELLEKYGFKDSNGNYMGDKAIGVAVSDNPAGPFFAKDEPLLYPKLLGESEYLKSDFGGQIIDPSVFTDDDGSSYILFGNGNAYMYKLGDDMMSIVDSTLRQLKLDDFRESVVLFKRNGIYHYTWSCDDTGSVNYHVNYGTARSITAVVTNRGTILQKNENEAIYGTGHQCTLYLPDTDDCYIAYARHQTKNGVSVSDPGNFREVCITKLSFDNLGYLQPAVPANTAVAPREIHTFTDDAVITPSTCTKAGVKRVKCSKCGDSKEVALPLAAHQIAVDKAVAPTFAKAGLTQGKHCKVCGKVIVAQKKVAKLVPSPTSIASVSAKSKGFVVKWKKQTKNTTGYQLQYSLSSNFKASTKTLTISSNKTVQKSVLKLKAKKKYFVRIRTYKQVGSKKYYSSWSKSKSVTTKK